MMEYHRVKKKKKQNELLIVVMHDLVNKPIWEVISVIISLAFMKWENDIRVVFQILKFENWMFRNENYVNCHQIYVIKIGNSKCTIHNEIIFHL